MYNKVYFYCHYGNGDIHESREFVKDMIELIPSEYYFYAHGKSPRILEDIPKLISTEVTSIMDMRKDIYEIDNDLYINTWIGRDSSYVLPGIGCILTEYYRMYNDILAKIGLHLSRPIIDYLPNIDYSYFNTKYIDNFLKWEFRKKVLICNGPVQSCQAENFNWTPIINRLNFYYPEVAFIMTQIDDKINSINCNPNISFTSEIIKSQDRFDLNEISYLSTFCDIIIGRSSGPFLFSQVRENWMNPNKKFLSFTYQPTGANIVLGLPVLAKMFWSDLTDEDGVYYKCVEAIES
jgi:hypothetical protein